MSARNPPPTEDVDWDDLCNFTPKQLIASDAAETHLFTLFGGARGPGKSRWLRWWLVRFLVVVFEQLHLPGVRAGLFAENYPELRDRQISKIKIEMPLWLGEVKETQADGLGFFLRPEWGGGMLALRNLDDPSKYQSAEFAAIGVDELTKNTVDVFNILRGSLRWPGIPRAPFVAATNPGSIGHLWVKNYWVDRQYPPELEQLAAEFAFVPALPRDNPHLPAGYWAQLNTLPPDLARAWVEGDWNVFMGQAFSGWTARNVSEPFEIPRTWRRWRAIDWGYRNPFCCLWLARDPDIGRVIVYRELYETGLTDPQQAAAITDASPKIEKIAVTYADPAMWAKKNVRGIVTSSADEYRLNKVVLTEGDNNRLEGKRKVDRMLMPMLDGLPGLIVFNTCTNLVRTLPALPYDELQTEDVDTDSEDHAYDALRYGLSRVEPRPAPPKSPALQDVKDALVARLRPGLARVGAGGLGSKDL